MIEAITGLLVGVLAIALARMAKGERWMYSVSLIALPSIYCLFALYAGEQTVGVKELMFGLPFFFAAIVFAFTSLPKSSGIVGVLWILHGAYDLTHHLFFTNPGAPAWYPVFCASVDAVIGCYLLWLCARLNRTRLHAT